MAGNGEVYSKTFNGRCTVGLNRRKRGTINKRAEEYLKAVSNSLGEPAEGMLEKKYLFATQNIIHKNYNILTNAWKLNSYIYQATFSA